MLHALDSRKKAGKSTFERVTPVSVKINIDKRPPLRCEMPQIEMS